MLQKLNILLVTVAVGALMPTSGITAVEGEVLIGYSLGYDDNINRNSASAGQEEDISNEIYFDIELSKRTGFLRYDVFGRTGFTAHSATLMDDQAQVSGGADIIWFIAPNRFSWDVSNVATLRRRDAGTLESSSNTEQTNIFQTGPTFYFRPFARTTLDLGAYYQQSWYEFSDSNEYIGMSADLAYRYSSLTDIDAYATEVHYLPDGGDFSDQVSILV